ncbi:MAG: hypothetical protein ACLPQI_13260 [Steroidobacteraceae bacterium]
MRAAGFGSALACGGGDFARAEPAAAGFADAGFAAALGTDLAAGLGAGLWGFSDALDVADAALAIAEGRAALAETTLRVAFFGLTFPGFLAALIGFFEGICCFRLLSRERAIIPTQSRLYRPSRQHLLTLF